MKSFAIASILLLMLAACGTPVARDCPTGYENGTRCFMPDNNDRPDRERSAPSKESEDRGEQDSPT